MTNEQVVGVGVRVVGIWILVSTAATTFSHLQFLFYPKLTIYSIVYLGFILFWLLLATFLIIKPVAIAYFLLPERESPKKVDETGWNLDEFQAVLFSAIGIWFVVFSISNIQGWFLAWTTLAAQDKTVTWHLEQLFLNMGPNIIQLISGIWLLFGAKGLRGLIRYIRNLHPD